MGWARAPHVGRTTQEGTSLERLRGQGGGARNTTRLSFEVMGTLWTPMSNVVVPSHMSPWRT